MSWLIEHRKKDDKYRIWTTISDGWITDWLSKQSIVKFLKEYQMEKAKINCNNIEKTFPNGWWNKKGIRYWNVK